MTGLMRADGSERTTSTARFALKKGLEVNARFDETKTERLIPTNWQDTSVESRNELEYSGKKHQYRKQIYNHIKSCSDHGATCDEVEVSLNLRHQTASCFIRFLTQDGFLFDSGLKRLTRANRKAIVWVSEKSVQIYKDYDGQFRFA